MASSTNDYRISKPGKLKLKGNKQIFDKKAKKRKIAEKNAEVAATVNADVVEHAGWWSMNDENFIKSGPVAIEKSGEFTYLSALDNGFFVVGGPHGSNEEPYPEEIFTLFKTPDSQFVTLKTGYGKYIGVDRSSGRLSATSEAISNREKWEIVFENQKTALQSAVNNCFLSFSCDQDGYVLADSKKAQENEIVELRTNRERDTKIDLTPDLDKIKDSGKCEVSYVKLYQHSKVKLNPEDQTNIKKARDDGSLHETLLDRREKMKSDKFCK